jgi:hypothetical protein
MIEERVVNILRDSSGVGAICADRIYLMTAPQQETFPYIVVSTVSASRPSAHDGAMGVTYKNIQVSCISNKVSTAKTLAQAARRAIHGFRGSVSGETIFYASVQNEIDLADPDYGFQVALDVEISFAES